MIHRGSKTLSLAVILSLFIGNAAVPAIAASPSNQGESGGTHRELRDDAGGPQRAVQDFLSRMRSIIGGLVQTVQQVVTPQGSNTCS
jgi:hypothetical protein